MKTTINLLPAVLPLLTAGETTKEILKIWLIPVAIVAALLAAGALIGLVLGIIGRANPAAGEKISRFFHKL